MKKSRKKKSCLVNFGRWMSYAAAGAVTAMAATNDAEATIWYSGPLTEMNRPPRTEPNPNPSLPADGLSSAHNLLFFIEAVGSHGRGFQEVRGATQAGSTSLARFAHVPGGGTNAIFPNNAARIASGVKISGLGIQGFATSVSHSFAYQSLLMASASHPALPWSGSGTVGFLVFEFKPNATSPQLYGWAKVENTDGGPWNDFELLGYAYSDNPNFVTGQTVMPEPATLSMLSFGAVGLLAFRRSLKRKAVA